MKSISIYIHSLLNVFGFGRMGRRDSKNGFIGCESDDSAIGNREAENHAIAEIINNNPDMTLAELVEAIDRLAESANK